MSDTRERILDRLRNQPRPPLAVASPAPRGFSCSGAQCIAHFTGQMQAVRGEVQRIGRDQWLNWLALELPARGLRRLLAGNSEIGAQLGRLNIRGTETRIYDRPVESCKSALFDDVDVAITGARCGIAETGTLVLWPDPLEPRLMSLLPPVHIALLEAGQIYPTLTDAMREQRWREAMPSNLVLVSGPSKTADIEQTLAYGIHGPRELITLILE